jgi:hypothetical protein
MFDYSGQSPYTKQIIQQLAAQGSRPVRNVGEGLASAGNSIMAAILAKKDMAEGKRRDEATYGALQNAIGADPSLANDPLIQGVLSNPDVGRQLAPEILGRVLQNRLTPEKQNLPTSFREYQLAQEDPNFGQYLTDSQSRKGTKINNVVNTGQNEFAKGIGKGISADFVAQRENARDAALSLQASNEALQLLDSGVITGFGAEFKVGLGKALQQAGVNFADDAVSNTEAFAASRAAETGRIIKMFGAGTGLSDADREFARKAAAGEITMTEQSIRRILDINARASQNVLKQYNDQASQIDPATVPFDLMIDVPEYNPSPQTADDPLGIR